MESIGPVPGKWQGLAYLGVQRGAGAGHPENNQPPSAFPPSPRAATKSNTRQPLRRSADAVGTSSLPVAAAALRCRTSPATLLTHAHQPEWHRALHTAEGTLRTPARESLTPGTLTLIPGARLPGRA